MILVIAQRELRSLFASPLAWAVLAVLQLVLAWIFLGRLDAYLQLQPQLIQLAQPPGVTEAIAAPTFGAAALLLLLAVPLLGMGAIAEERRQHTLTLLLSAPVSPTEIVLGKFLGLYAFLLLVLALVALMPLALLVGGRLDWGLLGANLLGLALVVAAMTALCLYVSCLTAHPATAAIAGFGLSLGFWLLDAAATDPESPLHALSMLRHYESFARGLFDSGGGAYFLLFAAVFLLLAIRRLDGDRFRG